MMELEHIGGNAYRTKSEPMSTFRDAGLLWIINKQVFHPHGLALSLEFDDNGTVTAWSVWKDNEPWGFTPEDDNESFNKLQEFLKELEEAYGKQGD